MVNQPHIEKIRVSQYFDGENYHKNKCVTVVDGIISAIDPDDDQNQLSLGVLVPGFIDIQVNGGGGVLFNQQPTLQKLTDMFKAHAQFGTTAMLPTLITDKVEVMAAAADVIAQAIKAKTPGVLGIHFEGPHLSVAKKGAHSQEFIREISEQEWQILSRKDLGNVVVTLAPETVNSADITRMKTLGINVCIGHSNADFYTAQQAVDAGANGFTHLYNAMSPLQGRAPGVTGCALLNDSAFCGMIVDGHHVDYASCRLAVKAKPQGKLLLVTDAMPPVGTALTEFSFFNRQVFLHKGKLTSSTGELAGSVLTMAKAVSNMVEHVGVSQAEALRMASLYPAQYLGLKGRGRINIGDSANLVLLSEQGDVIQTWVAGKTMI